MWGKDKQKRHPRCLEWRLMFIWDYVAPLRFPFLRGPLSTKAKTAFSCAEALFFRTEPPLTKASFRRCGTARKKRPTFVERFCFGRDSVGIRTQDPQLRRLLLYPTELPNRSLFACGKVCAFSVRGCKDSDLFLKCNIFLRVLFQSCVSKWCCGCYDAFLLLISFPAISMPVTRKKPIRAKAIAWPYIGSI